MEAAYNIKNQCKAMQGGSISSLSLKYFAFYPLGPLEG